MDPESSFELIRRAQQGDSSALEQLLGRYRPRLRRWATGRLPREARTLSDTEDLVQEALVGAFRNIQNFGYNGEWALQAYLRRAVINRIRDELRRVRHAPRAEQLDEALSSAELSPLEAAVGRETFTRYEAALEGLESSEREAVVARLELGCSFQEIARLIDKPSPDAARMTVSRAIEKLAATMAKHCTE